MMLLHGVGPTCAMVKSISFRKRPAQSWYSRSGDGLSAVVERAARAAGLPAKCVPHGLRKALMRRLAERGATTKQIASVSGHKTLKEVERYTAAADQARLARATI